MIDRLTPEMMEMDARLGYEAAIEAIASHILYRRCVDSDPSISPKEIGDALQNAMARARAIVPPNANPAWVGVVEESLQREQALSDVKSALASIIRTIVRLKWRGPIDGFDFITLDLGEGTAWYWYAEPGDISLKYGPPGGVLIHGPFKTKAEAREHLEATMEG
jgi:SpoVK/Ycf46/Vps4 family AAA+-type ATPase